MRNTMKVGALALLVGCGFVVSGCDDKSSNNKTEEKPTSDDILKNEKFLADNPNYVPAIQKLIKLSGYECPSISALWNRGISPYGLKLEALCGPNDGSGNSYSKLHYAVYPEKFKVNVCEEFSAFGPDCS